ncbi:MAG: hypothetical protein C4549_02815 [Deltaproteobacteria bacterium]|jgi:phage I-like protein|nr:MAG: hypothetical protein C4549_02815 [Deltaproteobacteria bacterium]
MKIIGIFKEMDGAPAEFQLLPYGQIEIEGEDTGILDDEGMRSVIDEFQRRGNDMVIDYEHQTLKDVEAPAAGWIKKLVDKGKDGLWAVVEWTERAKKYLQEKEYRYFSPVFWLTTKGRKVVKIEHVALTNYPKINNLKPIMAKLSIGEERENKKLEEIRKEEKMLEKIKKLFGLADDANEEKIIEAVEGIIAKNKELETREEPVACKEVMDALGVKPGAKKEEVIAVVAGMKVPGDVAVKLSLQVAELQKEISAMRQEGMVAIALKDGKTSPAELDAWGRDLALKNPEQFKLIILSRPAGSVIPIDKIPQKKDTGGPAELDDVQRSINKLCGVDDETFKKYNK